MKAVQYREIGKGPGVVDIDVPEPGAGRTESGRGDAEVGGVRTVVLVAL